MRRYFPISALKQEHVFLSFDKDQTAGGTFKLKLKLKNNVFA